MKSATRHPTDTYYVGGQQKMELIGIFGSWNGPPGSRNGFERNVIHFDAFFDPLTFTIITLQGLREWQKKLRRFMMQKLVYHQKVIFAQFHQFF